MRRFIRKLSLGSAAVLALCIGGAALDYTADPVSAAAIPGNFVTSGCPPSVSQASESWRGGDAFRGDAFRKDDIRWAQLKLRYRGLYRGSLDGVLGPETRQALEQFQKNTGLDQTVLLDAQTSGKRAPANTEVFTRIRHAGQYGPRRNNDR